MEGNDFFSILKIPMKFGGFWIYEDNASSIKSGSKIYEIYSRVMKYFYILFVFGLLGALPSVVDTDDYTNHVLYINSHCICLLKVYIFTSKKLKRLMTDIILTEKEILSGSDLPTKKVYFEVIKDAKEVFTFFLVNTGFMVVAFYAGILYSLIDVLKQEHELTGNTTTVMEKPLFYHFWFPFDIDENYYSVFIFEMVAVLFVANQLVITDCLTNGFIVHCNGQFRLLGAMVENYESYFDQESENYQDLLYDYLRKWTMMYERSIRFTKQYDESFKTVMLLDFLFRATQIITMINRLFEIGINTTTLFFLFFLIICFLQVLIGYWYANELTENARALGSVLYHTNWPDQSKEVKQLIIILMIRSKSPIELHIGPLYGMSITIMTQMVKSIYAYLTVYKNLY